MAAGKSGTQTAPAGSLIAGLRRAEGFPVPQGMALVDAITEAPKPVRARLDALLAAHGEARAVLAAVVERSPFLTDLIRIDPARLLALLEAEPVAALAQARASVAEARANVTRRELELSHATVRSPIAGRIDQALTTEGSLASVGASTALAVVQQIDSVYLDVRQSSIRREQLEERLDPGRNENAGALPVEILTITGKPYGLPGKILFSESTVDPGTGSIAMRVEVPNPDRHLLPGMYLRARVPSAIYPDALTVPQQAVRRDPSGRAQLTLIGSDNAASIRDVELGPLVERQYVVLSGLKPGETVVVEGQDRVAAGQALELVPYQPPSPKSDI